MSRSFRWLPLALPLLIFWLTGVAGLDYGDHWDEPKLLESVRTSVYEGVYLPTFYNYPSVSHSLGILSALPEIVKNIDRNHLNEPVFHGHIAAFQLDNHSVTLRTRLVFLTVSSLAIVWIYALMLTWRGQVGVALFSSSVLAFSWEVAYHARWIAPDTILMQFGTLWLLFVVMAYQRPQHGFWLWGSVVIAGLATGTKYPAGLFLLPVLMLVYWQRQSWITLVQAIAVFALTYLITTPGTLLQPFRFWYQVEYEMWHYSFGHSNHTVSAGLEHLIKNIEYLATVQLSQFPMIALMLFTLSLLGVWVLWHESRRFTLLIFLFPLLYLLFMSMQRAMLIRNLLVLVPFVAVACGVSAQWLWCRIDSRVWRGGIVTIAGVMLAINVVWLIYSAHTITQRHSDQYLADTQTWIVQHPDIDFFASQQVYDDLDDANLSNLVQNLSIADEVLVYLSKIQIVEQMPVNIPDLLITQFGSWEVNIEYYTWHGDDKILLLPMHIVDQYGLQDAID